jgi:hypothetical protein
MLRAMTTHALAFADVSFEVDAKVGGRVTALRLGSRNLLTGPEVDPGNYGSTFWTSPQAVWGWPPIPEIDNAPYKVKTAKANELVLRGPTSPTLGVSVDKRFVADPAAGAIRQTFTIHNHGKDPITTAPWQITRVAAGGLTFFPSGVGTFAPSNLTVHSALGVTWYAFDPAEVTGHHKLFADGAEGWLAHVDRDALLVKTFAPVARSLHAPGEAQIEIYASPSHRYVEIEPQGAYETIAPKGASVWRVTWLARKLPLDIVPALGSAQLLAYVRGVVAADAAAAAAVE